MFHIIHTLEDVSFYFDEYKSKGYTWIQENHPDYIPQVLEKDLPIILVADEDKTLMFGIIEYYEEQYFSNPKVLAEYNRTLRNKKLTKLNG